MSDTTTGIKKVTVLGAGVLGAQIAFQAAYYGYEVTSWDINDDALEAAKKRFDSFGERYPNETENGTAEGVEEARSRLHQTADLEEAVKDADLVIEAVPERLDIKRDVWGRVGSAVKEGAILASNSSTLVPSVLAPLSGHEEDFLHLHFANNIWIRNIAEVMPHSGTKHEHLETLDNFAKSIGMETVVMEKEKAGYVMNSLSVPFLEAAQELWADGYASIEDIDRNWRITTGNKKGPFQMMDTVGLRTVYSIALNHAEEPDAPEWVKTFSKRLKEEYLDEGKLGDESGVGFYDPASGPNA